MHWPRKSTMQHTKWFRWWRIFWGGMNVSFVYLTYSNFQRQILCNLVEGYKKNKWARRHLWKILQEAKELNIPHRNCMKTKQELEKAIVDTQRMYNYNIIGNDTHICIQNKKIIERTFKTRLMENTIRKLT